MPRWPTTCVTTHRTCSRTTSSQWIWGDDEAGLRYEDDVLVEILPPGTRRLYWRGPIAHRLERVDLAQDSMLPAALVKRIAQPALRARGVAGLTGVLLAQVPAYHVGVLKIDGKIERLLEPGVAAYWRFNRDVAVELVDLRLQALEVGGQEILTRDKVALRLNLSATWCYADVLHAFGQLQSRSSTCIASCSSRCVRPSARARSTSCWRTSRRSTTS